jgi:hypothetical protein
VRDLVQRQGEHRGDRLALAVDQPGRCDLPQLERKGVEVRSAEFAVPMDFGDVLATGLAADQVAVDFRQEGTAPARQQVFEVRVLRRVARDVTHGPPGISTSVRNSRACFPS